MKPSLPRSLFSIIGWDMSWKLPLAERSGKDLLTTPAPAPVSVDDLIVDERLVATLNDDGAEPLH